MGITRRGYTEFERLRARALSDVRNGLRSVAYGRGQGGIVDIRSRPGRTDRWAVGGEMSLLDASARAEGPARGGNVPRRGS